MKRTPLYNVHIKLNAKMVDFHDYIMPLQYGSIIDEHLQVRK
ncbi:MAG: glycine cleavage system protein T, partial [Planctomycetota bacterium]